jgi:uncharacterized damage-inducible protein DinB
MLSELLLSKWDQVRSDLLTTAEKFSDDELGYRPFDGAYSVAELLLHIAHEEAIEVSHGTAHTLAEFPPPYDATGFRDKESVLSVLTGVHAQTTAYLERASDDVLSAEIDLPWGGKSRPVDMLWHVLEHELHHRGELSLMLGLLGREGLDA